MTLNGFYDRALKSYRIPYGFSLLAMKINPDAPDPSFKESVLSGECIDKIDLAIYYTNRYPSTEYHVHNSLVEAAKSKGIPLKIVKLETMEQAQTAPSPATIFTLFYNGRFITIDLSICIDKRLEKLLESMK